MTKDEVKLRIVSFVNKTLDAYIPQTSIVDKLKNSTIKLWFEQNINKFDPFISTFADSNDNIDIKHITHYYEEELFENGELKLDVRDLIPNEYNFVKQMLPNKLILFKKNDLVEIFEEKK